VGGGDRGTEPTIVSFRVTEVTRKFNVNLLGSSTGVGNPSVYILLTRMWSDGTVEMNVVGNETVPNPEDTYLVDADNLFTGWRTVTDSVAGYACAGDTDGNREVDIYDLLAVVDQWGQCEEDPPTDLPDDPDLM